MITKPCQFAATLWMVTSLSSVASAANVTWMNSAAFDEVTLSSRALVIVLDRTSERSTEEHANAKYLKRFILAKMTPGRPLYIVVDDGDGMPVSAFEREYLVKPVTCSTKHIFVRLLTSDNRDCTTEGFDKAQSRFNANVDAAFAPYFEPHSSDQSAIFQSIASMMRMLQMNGHAQADLILLSDGLENSRIVRYEPGAPWLVDSTAQKQLKEQLQMRRLLPNLSDSSLQFVSAGRPHHSTARVDGVWLTPEEFEELQTFWAWYGKQTKARVALRANFMLEELAAISVSVDTKKRRTSGSMQSYETSVFDSIVENPTSF